MNVQSIKLLFNSPKAQHLYCNAYTLSILFETGRMAHAHKHVVLMTRVHNISA